MKHRRRKTDAQNETPEQTAKRFDDNIGEHVTRVADKRLKGQAPYNAEPDQLRTKRSGFFSNRRKK